MLSPPIIGNIRSFLERVQLTGKEVPAFNQVMTALAVEENINRQGLSLVQTGANDKSPAAEG